MRVFILLVAVVGACTASVVVWMAAHGRASPARDTDDFDPPITLLLDGPNIYTDVHEWWVLEPSGADEQTTVEFEVAIRGDAPLAAVWLVVRGSLRGELMDCVELGPKGRSPVSETSSLPPKEQTLWKNNRFKNYDEGSDIYQIPRQPYDSGQDLTLLQMTCTVPWSALWTVSDSSDRLDVPSGDVLRSGGEKARFNTTLQVDAHLSDSMAYERGGDKPPIMRTYGPQWLHTDDYVTSGHSVAGADGESEYIDEDEHVFGFSAYFSDTNLASRRDFMFTVLGLLLGLMVQLGGHLMVALLELPQRSVATSNAKKRWLRWRRRVG